MPLDESWVIPTKYRHKLSWRIPSRIVLTTVGLFSKIWIATQMDLLLEWLNTVKVYNKEVLIQTIDSRRPKRGIVTIANHHSCMDDPVLWGVLRWKYLIYNDMIRWTLAAQDICFTKYFHSLFFTLGKTLPVCRGEGVYQKSMDFMVDRINNGEWVHMFPEGKVNATKEYLRLKWGVGRLIMDADKHPVVLPIWHEGMDSILPNKTPYIPRIMQRVTCLVGDPMCFKNDIDSLREMHKTPAEIRKHITDKIQQELNKLRARAEELHRSLER